MCRNIRPLFNYDPPTTEAEVRAAALQYVRKVSGFTKPSAANADAFARAVDEITVATSKCLSALTTKAAPKDREIERQKAVERNRKRFGPQPGNR